MHPPEDPRHHISDSQNCLKLLRNQLQIAVYPVHRLDRATSGVLLFALDPQTASILGKEFQQRRVQKTYLTVVRGYLADEQRIERPLKGAGEAETHVRCIGRVELPWPNERYPTSRYSLAFAHPLTGRMHQIRRHLSGSGHPIIGDTVYGDGEHNRLYRKNLGIDPLCLHAHSLTFTHPATRQPLRLRARFPSHWHPIFDTFGICPYEAPPQESSGGI